MTTILAKSALPAAVLALAAAFVSGSATPAQACSYDSYYGTVCMTAASYCPDGFLDINNNGSLQQINQYQALYALLGTTYGGDGRNTFGLPGMGARTIVGTGQGPGLTNWPQGVQFGADAVSLTLAQMPAHTHVASLTATVSQPQTQPVMAANSATGSSPTPVANGVLAGMATAGRGRAGMSWAASAASPVAVGGISATAYSQISAGTITNQNAGQGQAFIISPPQVAVRYCINVIGEWPPQPN